ncbi:hypothetical protein [Thermococcus waiotapuensis]|uniref:Uncharacterized protein n=1 Tax=Thermococcus waiotapuensis TaxID=90909 RepID=A0AAE4NW04_9EURY|nr:hypothetical protein [Thermococcus waiotapuensis]MDV3103863.1 hypothetical protein [Thermococcus waiotapuensis]
MRYVFRLLLFLRLVLRLLAFTYPLFLTLMYNFWVFERLPMVLWIGYVVIMALWELVSGIFADRPLPMTLLKTYAALAIFLEFPSVLLSSRLSTTVASLPWVSLWYGSLIVLALLAARTFRRR